MEKTSLRVINFCKEKRIRVVNSSMENTSLRVINFCKEKTSLRVVNFVTKRRV